MRKLYERLWDDSNYRVYSPGEEALPIFHQLVHKKGTLVDIGCGTGRAGQALAERGFEVTLMDFASNAPEVDLPFRRGSIFGRWPGDYDYGYCCDVMEHLEPDRVERALKAIFRHCRKVFFTIHFGPDNFGETVGHPLHLTQQCFVWWRDLISRHARLYNARDLIGMGSFYAGW